MLTHCRRYLNNMNGCGFLSHDSVSIAISRIVTVALLNMMQPEQFTNESMHYQFPVSGSRF